MSAHEFSPSTADRTPRWFGMPARDPWLDVRPKTSSMISGSASSATSFGLQRCFWALPLELTSMALPDRPLTLLRTSYVLSGRRAVAVSKATPFDRAVITIGSGDRIGGQGGRRIGDHLLSKNSPEAGPRQTLLSDSHLMIWRRSWRRLLPWRFEALLEPITLAGDFHYMHAVGQPVDDRPGQPGVAGEDAGPFRERKVRCHYQTHLLVALTEESKQVLGPACPSAGSPVRPR